MNHNLYTEAIADAKQLRDLAEASAKNKIIEAITPRIRDLIERQLLGEDDDLENDDDIEDTDDSLDAGNVDTDLPGDVDDDLLQTPESVNGLNQQAPTGKTTNVSMNPDGHVSLTVGGVNIDISDSSGTDLDLGFTDDNLLEAVKHMVFNNRKNSKHSAARQAKLLEMKLNYLKIQIKKSVSSGMKRSDSNKFKKIFESLARQAVSLRSNVILTEQDVHVKHKINTLIKEMKDMSRKNSKNIFDFLFEGEDCDDKKPVGDLEEADDLLGDDDDVPADDGDDAGSDEQSESPADTDAVVDYLEKALAALKGEDVVDDDSEDLDLGSDDDSASAPDADVKEEAAGTFYEIDENVLRRELRKMRKLAETTSGVADPKQSARAFADGDVEDEMFVDVDEDSLLNALVDELGNVKFGGKAQMTAENRSRRQAGRHSSRLAEARELRTLKTQLAEYKTATTALKEQLVEMNLFNAKLLYANKLMQNKNLTQKQQRAIVEALDSAKTLNEARLLYKSLTASLNKSKPGSSLREGATRTSGSSSRSTPSAQKAPATNGVEVDRWAVLAGIAGNK